MINVQEILRAIKPYVLGWIRDYWVYLNTPLASTSFDGDSFSTTAKTLIDLSTEFGVPAGVKAVLVNFKVRDEAAATADAVFILGPTNVSNAGLNYRFTGGFNDYNYGGMYVIPCNANGDIYYQIIASGTNTLDVHLEIWGWLP